MRIKILLGFILIFNLFGCNSDKTKTKSSEPITIEKSLESTGPADQATNYEEIGKKIAKMDNDELIKKYIDFILRTQGSADELRSYGLGHIYSAQPLKMIETINSKSAPDQEVIFDSLAFGLANIYYKEMTTENAKSLIVGSRLEVYKQGTAQIIYEKVLAILKAN